MPVRVIGISHHTAPLEVRERFVFDPPQVHDTLDHILEASLASEAVLLSTCNRTEAYVYAAGGSDGGVRALLTRLLAERAGLSQSRAAAFFYEEHERAAIEHLFRVSASLDSMILGEPQIQGQVREAYEWACDASQGRRRVGPVLTRLFETALSIGGRVRSQTALGAGAASVPSAAVDLARKIFGSLKGKTAAVLGTGEMSRVALECLMSEGVTGATVVSRTDERARALAVEAGAAGVSHESLPDLLAGADIIITATAAPHAVITAAAARRALPHGRRHPLLMVDIALPRDIEPAVGDIENVFLYNIDDLQQVVDGTIERRKQAVPVAERIVQEGVTEFWQWYRGLDVVPLIRELRDQAEAIRQQEVERALRGMRHLSAEDAAAIDALTRQLLKKVLHRPTVRLKEAATGGNESSVLKTMRYLLGLEKETDDTNGK